MPSRSNVITDDVTEMPRARSISSQFGRVRRCWSPRAVHLPASGWRRRKEQLLGQRGLAGVRVRDDREGAPRLDGRATGGRSVEIGSVRHKVPQRNLGPETKNWDDSEIPAGRCLAPLNVGMSPSRTLVRMQITLINHACVKLSVGGMTVLCDPGSPVPPSTTAGTC